MSASRMDVIVERIKTIHQQGILVSPEITELREEYTRLLEAEDPIDGPPHSAEEPLEEPQQLHGGRVLIKGIQDGSVSSIDSLLRDHLGLLLDDPRPLRLNELSGQVEHAGSEHDLADLVTRLRIETERKVCFETKKLDEQGRPVRAKLRLPTEDTRAVALQIARSNRFSPVAEWLESLPTAEPGAIKLAATEALGLTDDLSLLLWRKWLIGAVARALRPGCKMDTVLLLVAPKGGEGKSTLFRVLTGDRWTSSTKLDIDGFRRQDGYIQLHSAWIYELKEIGSRQTAESREAWKSFLDESSDDYREPYGSTSSRHPRSVVFGASSNSLDILSSEDTAYNRRFWPIRIAGRIDTEMVARLRESIWAEALEAFRAGEPWHLDEDQETAMAALAERHLDLVAEDAWLPLIRAHVEAPVREGKALRIMDVARLALGFERAKFGMADQRRLGSVLHSLGFESRLARWRPGEEKSWRWSRGIYSEGSRDPFDE